MAAELAHLIFLSNFIGFSDTEKNMNKICIHGTDDKSVLMLKTLGRCHCLWTHTPGAYVSSVVNVLELIDSNLYNLLLIKFLFLDYSGNKNYLLC